MLCNSKDESFIELRFDQHSLKFFTDVLIKQGFIGDPLTGLLVWDGLYAMMRHGTQGMTPDRFLKAVISALEVNQPDAVFSSSLQRGAECIYTYCPIKFRDAYKKQLFNILKKFLLLTDPANGNKCLLIRRHIISFAQSVEDIKFLVSWFEGKEESYPAESLTVDDKWSIVNLVFACKYPEFEGSREALFDLVKAIDPEPARNNRKFCDATLCNTASKLD